MPLHWTVESRLKLVTVVAEGDVSKSDVEAYLSMVGGANIVEWRKLFDARAGRPVLTLHDVHELGARIRAADAVRIVGPLAFVMPENDTPELMRLLGFLAAAKRPMRLFRDIGPARKWLMKADAAAGGHGKPD